MELVLRLGMLIKNRKSSSQF